MRARLGRRTLRLGVIAVAAGALVSPAGSAVADTDSGVPNKFLIANTSWSTPTVAWLFGFAPGDDGREAIFLSTDNVIAWHRRTLPVSQVGIRSPSQIVFEKGAASADDGRGYFTGGHTLYTSSDGGDSWTRVTLPGARESVQIGEIAIAGGRVYVIVGDGSRNSGQTRLFAGAVGADHLRPVAGVRITGNAVNVDGTSDVAAHGSHVAVALGEIFVSSKYWSSSDGHSFESSAPPCTKDEVTDLGQANSHRVAALCSYNPGIGHMFKDIRVSTDGGPFEQTKSAPDDGITREYVSTGPRNDTITAVSGASFLYRSKGDEWRAPINIGGGLEMSELQYIDRKRAVVLIGSVASHTTRLFISGNGGRFWDRLHVQ